MYKTLRKIHGYLGLALAAAVFFYAISGWLIYHGGRFGEPVVVEARVTSDAFSAEAKDRAAARRIVEASADELAIVGRFKSVRPAAGGWHANFKSASVQQEVRWIPGQGTASIKTRTFTTAGALAGLHRVYGTSGGPAHFAFAILVDFVALAMLGFALSGVYLWWKIKRKRMPGWVTLGASTAATVGLVLQLILAR